ncbi:MAG: galactose-1-phosphate uridylyltransferase [Candidatus Ryanbacteria bacterium RIFCSPHIGHO2_02_FULL_45_43]|uniref:Galactose-1-phosphate uridylyltransferase n=1 Tax=Candidatus Ryanbacteria bacterium RIFCSPHIGHO2_01_45_13 TaxID=1802112 RepID=A0A1G2FXV9_9BACT|nr:MAG: galactose-1-phosphate uridylyltransferase [Candidatus Ryanbacteria bacterium RIFCSPHIGHO2_01_FULL_44_130]OGZ42450.1 MAG: galactose-1-phosphate uridylyltransferase [Candidatus Ryanbacteria bacterium RIFCSPHIGHO2_01_45_13]OGZ48467.1 MAG: galactose-1-phosphate uridylyltransferase [Candidatus Ryanbacteria bacterium RIFCSPHIGHO2_02_FULL_45_43]OGZ50332.1 MAG: galactose-1-phosphate uridylyltransferase [Candidatus Ryanbacteria bacterium RIFCSPHIGHO2_12_FULL_44_20]OGZ51671.1 MAG: galactose-1-pho
MEHPKTELRQDPVSGEWVLLSTVRARRPNQFARSKKEKSPPRAACPFEDPQKSGNGSPLLWFVHPQKRKKGDVVVLRDWFLQVIRNKYPALSHHYKTCPTLIRDGVGAYMQGVGFHEVVVTSPHSRSIAHMSVEEVELIIRAYQERIHDLSAEKCLEYVLVFHNHGREAGASIYHPHSQLIALPIVPADVHVSIQGSRRYYHRKRRCVHCDIIRWERRKKERVLYKNKSFILLAPHVSKAAFEMRIYPLKHQSRFESIATKDRPLLADVLIAALRSIYRGLNDIAYNYFIHTTPFGRGHFDHYHWHLEILPKTATFGGVELGTGLEIVTVSPEDAAQYLRRFVSK